MAVKRRAAPPRSRPAQPVGLGDAPVAIVTLGLLFLLPILFTPGQLVEEFEFPKSLLLTAGALLLLAWWIAAESSRLAAAGIGSWLRGLPARLGSAVRRDPLGAAVALMLLSAVLSTLTSIRPPLSLFGAPQSHAGLRTIAGLGAVYYASRSLAARPRWFRRLALATGAGAAVAAGYALVQIAHLDPIVWSRHTSFQGLIRSGSTLGHANTLSAYLITALPLVAWLAARARTRAAAWGWTALAAACLFIVLASLSRGAWLGAAAGLLVAGLLALLAGRKPSPRWTAVAAAAVVLVLAVAFLSPMRAAMVTRVSQIADTRAPTSRTRVELWRSGLRMFGDHPALGAGLDAFLAAFPKYRSAELTRLEWGGTPGKAHNDAIQILATQGLLGGLAGFAILLLAAAALARIARRGDVEARDAAIVTGAALAAYLASSLVGFGTSAVSALAAALAGWAARASRPAEEHPVRESAPVRSAWNLAAGLLLALALGYFLVARPLRAEIALAEALHLPSGTPARDALLEKAGESAPWDPRYPAEVGRSYFNEALREPDQERRFDLLTLARRSLERSIAIAPENGENRILYATLLSAQSVLQERGSSREQVREEFRRAVALDPLSPVVLVGAERGLIAAGLTEDARELALRCARAYPEYAPPLADLGAIALEQGRTAAAAETLQLAVRRQWREDAGGAAHAWNDLAQALLALGRNAEAVTAADSALARDPRAAQAFGVKQAALRAMGSK